MIVAFTAWEERLSPVFYASRTLFIVHASEGNVIDSYFESFNPEIRWDLLERFKSLEIDVLICGAISKEMASLITSCDITLIPFIRGRIEQILEVYLRENHIPPDYLMPGCGRRRRRQFGRSDCGIFREEVKSMPNKDGKGPQGQRGPGQGRGLGQGPGRNTPQGGGTGRGLGIGGGGRSGKGRGFFRGQIQNGQESGKAQ